MDLIAKPSPVIETKKAVMFSINILVFDALVSIDVKIIFFNLLNIIIINLYISINLTTRYNTL